MAKTVIKKIKIIKKNNSKKQTLNEISDLMETCMISETESQKYKDLEMKITDLESQLMIKREQLRNVVLFLNGEKNCICMNKKSKVGKIEDIDKSLLYEEPLLDEDGESYNYFQNVMCVPCLVDYYYKRLNKLKNSTKKSNK
tara:strand:+ start:106 stop:531 length:426 start_codon:yes stop_codon:yes gene_type:complete